MNRHVKGILAVVGTWGICGLFVFYPLVFLFGLTALALLWISYIIYLTFSDENF